MSNDVMVSVLMLAYNHENYIGKAIESIIMQKVNFKYEIVIAEDCSTDDTRRIACEYKKKHPDKVKLILNPHNMGMLENGAIARKNCVGKYIAVLEGDDYWIDENKLQKQVDFLETHKNYSAVYHNVKIVDKDDKELTDRFGYEIYPETDMDKESFYKDLFVRFQTGSLVSVNYWTKMTEKQRSGFVECKVNGDQKTMFILTCMGDIHVFNECMSACRKVISGGSSWTAKTYNKNKWKYIFTSRLGLIKYAKECWNVQLDEKHLLGDAAVWVIISALKRRKKEDVKYAKDVFLNYNVKLYVIKEIFKKVLSFPFKKICRLRSSIHE